jgi:hypothetical protein
MSNSQGDWAPGPAVVALGIIALVAGITISAIFHYDSVDDALKFWAGLTALVGVITGAFVSYFFTRGTVETAKQGLHTAEQGLQMAQESAQTSRQTAQAAQETAQAAQKKALENGQALSATLGLITDKRLLDEVMSQAVREALEN